MQISMLAFTQQTDPPYKRFPTTPPLKLLLTDSSTIFTDKQLKKDTPLFFMLFSPDCEHCKKETEELIDMIDSFKHIQIVMATFMPVDKMKVFYDKKGNLIEGVQGGLPLVKVLEYFRE